jgi:hypothetical protein
MRSYPQRRPRQQVPTLSRLDRRAARGGAAGCVPAGRRSKLPDGVAGRLHAELGEHPGERGHCLRPADARPGRTGSFQKADGRSRIGLYRVNATAQQSGGVRQRRRHLGARWVLGCGAKFLRDRCAQRVDLGKRVGRRGFEPRTYRLKVHSRGSGLCCAAYTRRMRAQRRCVRLNPMAWSLVRGLVADRDRPPERFFEAKSGSVRSVHLVVGTFEQPRSNHRGE